MATLAFKGNIIHTTGGLPNIGSEAPEFELVGIDMKPIHLTDFKHRNVILNIFPSLDTDVCSTTIRRFNEEAAKLKDTTVICVSKDLPFAAKRFCTLEGIKNVVMASDFRDGKFGKDYGVTITDGAMKGLLARAVVALDKHHRVVYTHLVPDIIFEPPYEETIDAIKMMEKV